MGMRQYKTIQRNFFPGDRCAFFKIYSGEVASEHILIETLYPLIDSLIEDNIVRYWFFIRYADPDYHLRVRLFLRRKNSLGKVLHMFNRALGPYCKSNVVYAVDLSTYSREIERYGAENMIVTERLFYYDSACICAIIREIIGKESGYRWKAAFRLVDSFLNTLGYHMQQKIDCMALLNESFKKEFGFNEHNSKQLNDFYRLYKKDLERILRWKEPEDIIPSAIISLIGQRNARIRQATETDNCNINVHSYIHMMMNRLFVTDNRVHEVVIYNLLWRFYRSSQARNLTTW